MSENGQGWFSQRGNRPWWHLVLRQMLKFGPLPRHVAFVMDGNRRYARSHLLSSAVEGHWKGFERLTNILEWCRDLGVSEVTVYAFSIENFKRSQEEVDGLMELFKKKLLQLLDEMPKLEENQIAVRFFGDLSYLSPMLARLAAKIELSTAVFHKSVINVCIAYTSHDEIRRAFVSINHGIQKGLINEEDISEYLIAKCLDSRNSRKPDLLIRTSGERRFSDFLLWQCSSCYIHFDDTLWPDFGFWNLCKAIYGYQTTLLKINEVEKGWTEEISDSQKYRIDAFVEYLKIERIDFLKKLLEGQQCKPLVGKVTG